MSLARDVPDQSLPGKAETTGVDGQHLPGYNDRSLRRAARMLMTIPTIGDEFAERGARVRIRPEPKRRRQNSRLDHHGGVALALRGSDQ